MKKLLIMLFALAIFLPLAASGLAQTGDAAKGQATETQAKKKKKHHKKKPKLPPVVKGNSSMQGVTQA